MRIPPRFYDQSGISSSGKKLSTGEEEIYPFELTTLFDLSRPGTYTLQVSRKVGWDGKKFLLRPSACPFEFTIP
jgi:hypothetical protein